MLVRPLPPLKRTHLYSYVALSSDTSMLRYAGLQKRVALPLTFLSAVVNGELVRLIPNDH